MKIKNSKHYLSYLIIDPYAQRTNPPVLTRLELYLLIFTYLQANIRTVDLNQTDLLPYTSNQNHSPKHIMIIHIIITCKFLDLICCCFLRVHG